MSQARATCCTKQAVVECPRSPEILSARSAPLVTLRITRPALDVQPGPTPRWRLSVELVVRDGSRPTAETIWLEGPGSPNTVDGSGTPWAVMFAPLAAQLGQPLVVEAPVAVPVAEGIRTVSEQWSRWYDGVVPVRLEAPQTEASVSRSDRAATFFTGGVDSLWSALDQRETGASERDLICIHGFDLQLDEEDAFKRMTEKFGRWAVSWGGQVVALRTNLRTTRAEVAPWGPLAHGCALVGAGLALGPRYDVLRIAATGGRRDPHPWGSHVETDHLLGTGRTRIDHHGAEAARWEKVRRIVEDADALDLLRVCWRSGTDRNCGACSKCLRTMALLEVFNALERAPTFPDGLPLDALAHVHVKESWDVREFSDLIELATERDRPDVVDAARTAMLRSRWGGKAVAFLDRLAGTPGLGIPARACRTRIHAAWIS